MKMDSLVSILTASNLAIVFAILTAACLGIARNSSSSKLKTIDSKIDAILSGRGIATNNGETIEEKLKLLEKSEESYLKNPNEAKEKYKLDRDIERKDKNEVIRPLIELFFNTFRDGTQILKETEEIEVKQPHTLPEDITSESISNFILAMPKNENIIYFFGLNIGGNTYEGRVTPRISVFDQGHKGSHYTSYIHFDAKENKIFIEKGDRNIFGELDETYPLSEQSVKYIAKYFVNLMLME